MYYQKRGVMLRKWHGRLEAFLGSSNGGPMLAGSAPPVGSALGIFASAIIPLLMILAVVALVIASILHPMHVSSMASLSIFALGSTVITPPRTEPKAPANIRKMEADLKSIAKELEVGQSEMAAGEISQERGEELEAKAKQMESLQSHIDQYNRIASITQKTREVRSPVLPAEVDVSRKRVKTSAGHLFVMSDGYREYKKNSKQGWSSYVDLKGARFGKGAPIVLSGEQAIEFERKAFDPSTLSTLGTDAIVPIDRDPEIVRYAEPELFTIRDMLNEVSTTSDAIKYVRHTATVRAAAVQTSRGAAKSYLHVTFDTVTTNVETIAVLSKVTEQDIDDAPRLVGIINDEMELDVKVQEEQQLTWSDGSGGNMLGLFAPTSGITEFDRAQMGDTVIDTIRRMRTDLRKVRVVPSFVAIDPIDWEEIELTKGTTDQYIWGIITDLRGPRIWSLQVVESDAMTNNDTGERRLLLGDGKRGATVYNRQETRLAVGYVDDDFARNLRTLRAEERLALAIKRPYAFEYAVLAAGE